MTLYSGSSDIESHRTRIVLAEKGVLAEVVEIDRYGVSHDDWRDLNPYQTLPTLVDRDLVIYQARIIMEYLEERFPHPPLLPVYPVMRISPPAHTGFFVRVALKRSKRSSMFLLRRWGGLPRRSMNTKFCILHPAMEAPSMPSPLQDIHVIRSRECA